MNFRIINRPVMGGGTALPAIDAGSANPGNLSQLRCSALRAKEVYR